MVEAVIFDVDGTLIDSNDVHAHIWHEAFLEFGKSVPDEMIRESIGKGGDNLLPDFLTEDEIERIGEPLKRRRGEIAKEKYLDQLKPFTFARDLGQKIRERGIRIAIASSAKEDELQTMVRLAGFEDLIESQNSSDDAKRSKPEPDIFLAALAKLGNPDPNQVLTIGDSPYDVMGAKKAGLRTIAVLCGGFSEQSLKDAGAYAIYQSPSELFLRFNSTPLFE